MSSTIWTPEELSREAKPLRGECWRLVEAQHRYSSLKVVDTKEEQNILETLIEETKPFAPVPCQGLHFLLMTPFRYKPPHPSGSRFRRPYDLKGVYYGATTQETAVAEMCYHRLLFYADSPDTPWPKNPAEFTAFPAGFSTENALDLTQSPFAEMTQLLDLVDYSFSQAFSDVARQADVEVLKYPSARDPEGGTNIAILSCGAFNQASCKDFESAYLTRQQTWKIYLSSGGAIAMCAFPNREKEFPPEAFSQDPRIAGMKWDR